MADRGTRWGVMVGWLKLIVIAAAAVGALWALLVVLAARLPPGLLKEPSEPRLLERLIGAPSPHPAEPEAEGDEPGRT